MNTISYGRSLLYNYRYGKEKTRFIVVIALKRNQTKGKLNTEENGSKIKFRLAASVGQEKKQEFSKN